MSRRMWGFIKTVILPLFIVSFIVGVIGEAHV